MSEQTHLSESLLPLSWFVMRDLKRPNAKLPAYKFLAEQGLEVFTPMTWRLSVRHGKRR